MADTLITPRMQAVFARLEARDASEREHDVARAVRLRQIPREVGRFLQALVLASKPRTIVEIGASGGYSTTWLASAAAHVGARVTTLEIDPVKVALATGALDDAGLASVATIVAGDAFAWLRARTEPVDFFFLDAEKEDYAAFLDLVTPLLPVGGVLVADNLLSHPDDLAAFRERALADPRLAGLVVPIGRGELVAVRVA
jgi:caffeoyl-CoA O-methyltransferase